MIETKQPAVDFNLYLITDRCQAKGADLLQAVERALAAGVKALQLREKDLPSRELFDLAKELRVLTRRYQARLIINDRTDIALAVEADGVHLGENSMPTGQVRALLGRSRLIGVSCHDRAGAIAAQEHGADFITFGPTFFTPSKATYGPPVGLEALEQVTALLHIPVFGLGGINRRNAGQVLAAGAHGIALISAILAADDPRRAASEMLAIFDATALTTS